jgi:hypothetical protein
MAEQKAPSRFHPCDEWTIKHMWVLTARTTSHSRRGDRKAWKSLGTITHVSEVTITDKIASIIITTQTGAYKLRPATWKNIASVTASELCSMDGYIALPTKFGGHNSGEHSMLCMRHMDRA